MDNWTRSFHTPIYLFVRDERGNDISGVRRDTERVLSASITAWEMYNGWVFMGFLREYQVLALLSTNHHEPVHEWPTELSPTQNHRHSHTGGIMAQPMVYDLGHADKHSVHHLPCCRPFLFSDSRPAYRTQPKPIQIRQSRSRTRVRPGSLAQPSMARRKPIRRRTFDEQTDNKN